MKAQVIHVANENALRRASEVLNDGGLVAFPTDTVYGLGVLPWREDAVARLYEAKQRPAGKPVPLLLSRLGYLDRVARVPIEDDTRVKRLMARFWPGGLTLVFPKSEFVPDSISQGPTVAVRVPDLTLTQDLIDAVGGVLAVTSANLSGQPSPVNVQEVEEQLGACIDLVLNGGPSRGGVPSTILDCTVSPPKLLRRGAIPVPALRKVIGSIQIPT